MVGILSSVDQASLPPQQDMAQLLEDAEPIKSIRRGDVVTGEVMSVDQDGILVNIGHKSEGLIPSREMRSLSAEVSGAIQPGDEIFAYVVSSFTEEGPAILSVDRARGERGWQVLQKCLDGNTPITAIIKTFNKGGVVVEMEGIQGFVPLSQLAPVDRSSPDHSQEDALAQRVGHPIELKLLELNRRRNRVILSERLAMQQQREEQKDRLLKELQEGETRKGRVSGISSFGVFVDLGGADGLIHISEISWDPIQSPAEVAKVGDELEVYVLKVDQGARKIALSLRRLQPEPWETVADRYKEGQLVRGTITKLTNFGAFARIEDLVEGLIHISELSDQVVQHPKEIVEEGKELTLKIIRMEPERRRLGLSLKQVNDPWLEESYLSQ